MIFNDKAMKGGGRYLSIFKESAASSGGFFLGIIPQLLFSGILIFIGYYLVKDDIRSNNFFLIKNNTNREQERDITFYLGLFLIFIGSIAFLGPFAFSIIPDLLGEI